MSRLFLISLSILVLAGCATRPSRHGIISRELPLTIDDLAEIRAGEQNYKKVLEEYRLFNSPKLQAYANAVAAGIAEVSTRPHLPYQVVILDDEDVNIFGGPGGYIFITRGFFNFIESETELAGAVAHEIGHIAAYEYAGIPHISKMQRVYSGLLKGSELAKDSVGTYGTALHYGVKGVGKAAPYFGRRFGQDQEVTADEKALEYLLKAGYDPNGFAKLVDRLSKVPMEDVGRFVIFMNTHPPFQARREILASRLQGLDYDPAKIEFKKDLLNEVRQIAINAPDSILFEPQLGVHRTEPADLEALHAKDEKLAPVRKRWEWF